jgi:hypothetical protein
MNLRKIVNSELQLLQHQRHARVLTLSMSGHDNFDSGAATAGTGE